MREIHLIFIALFCFGLQLDYTSADKFLFEMFNTKLTGQQNLSYGFTLTRGLRPDEKQAILDMTNALRLKIATGQTDITPVGLAPNATNMFVMEWDDALAEFAQNWADRCIGKHSKLNVSQSNYTNAIISENISGGTVLIETTMFGEVRGWIYIKQECLPNHQCGHYNTLVSWPMIRLGCGYSVCTTGFTQNIYLFCEFAPFRSAGVALLPGQKRYRFQYEYITNLKPGITKVPDAYAPTEPCSECLQGWDYCMDGGLCATKEQCESDPNNKCVCKNDKTTCESNGGKFDAANCRCKCPADKMGLNCALKCQNEPGEVACGITCGWSMMELFYCYKACGSCGSDVSAAYKYWQIDRKTRNKYNLKVRATAPHPVPPIPKNVKTSSLPDRGKCKNMNSDYFCENIRRRNYCNSSTNGPMWKHYCASSCNTCNNKEWTDIVKAAIKRYEKNHPMSSSSSVGSWEDVSSSEVAGSSGWVPSPWTNAPSSGTEGWVKAPSSGSGGWTNVPSSSSGGWTNVPSSGGGWSPLSSSDYGSGTGSGGWSPLSSSDYSSGGGY